MLLTIDDLHVSFFTPTGEIKALNGVTFTVDSGEVIGIVGESGSGKSVTASVIAGLLQYPGRVTNGSLEFNGHNMLTLEQTELHNVRGKEFSMIFQDPMTSLNPLFTVGNQLIEMILLHTDMTRAQAHAHALKMLDLVGINNPDRRITQYPHELSGGMRQRVMIAMALSCEPKLLIADEPTTALDVTIQAQILDLMKKLKHETNAAVILITHDLGIVADICDTVVVMYAGVVVERGNVEEIYYQTAHPYTTGLLGCLPRLDSDAGKTLEPIEGTDRKSTRLNSSY